MHPLAEALEQALGPGARKELAHHAPNLGRSPQRAPVGRRRPTQSEKMAAEALAIEAEDARKAGALGFMARILVQTTLPHSRPTSDTFLRRNGRLVLSVAAHPLLGLPYGRYPRLLLTWLTTEAVRTKSPELHLGETLSGFMAQLGLLPRGGRWGTIGRLRDQMRRLFSATIAFTVDGREDEEWHDAGFRVTEQTHLWWDPKHPEHAALWGSTVTLSRGFFTAVTERPVPVEFRALKALRSPLALDIYCWLTHRMSYLERPSKPIPWGALQLQFGSSYGRTRAFRERFLRMLRQVLVVYPSARLRVSEAGVRLIPSPTHIASS